MSNKIMVIRHAEKPMDPPLTQGVDEFGNQSQDELVVRGWQRAGALSHLFSPQSTGSRSPVLAVPVAIYAAKAEQHSHSLRPQHTVAPLAALLGIPINVDFAMGSEAALADSATTASGVVLIAWHHEAISAIANAVVGDATTCPQMWPPDRFDVVWVFDKAVGGWQFSQVPQLLLSGDANTTI